MDNDLTNELLNLLVGIGLDKMLAKSYDIHEGSKQNVSEMYSACHSERMKQWELIKKKYKLPMGTYDVLDIGGTAASSFKEKETLRDNRTVPEYDNAEANKVDQHSQNKGNQVLSIIPDNITCIYCPKKIKTYNGDIFIYNPAIGYSHKECSDKKNRWIKKNED